MEQSPKVREKKQPFQRWNPRWLLSRYLRLNLNKRDDRNAYYLVSEVFWASFLNAAATFNVAYAIRLGASDQMIGLLSSIPALFAIFLSIPVAQILQQAKHKKPLLVSSLAVFRAGFIAIALVPWLNFLNIPSGAVVVVVLILFSITQRPFIVGFAPMMSAVLPPEKQAPVISARMQVMHAVQSGSVFLLGFWLDAVVFPLNYTIMYIATVVLSVISILLIRKIEYNDKPKVDVLKTRNIKTTLQSFIKVAKNNPRFMRYTMNVFLMDFGMWASIPLFSLYYLNVLNATDGWLGTFSSINNVSNIVGYGLWRPFVNRIGPERLIRYVALLRPLWPLTVALAPNLTFLLFAGAAWGLIVPGLGLCNQSLFLRMLPVDAREEGQALHSTIQNTSMFISPLIGIAIAEAIGIPNTLFIFAGVRLLGSLMWTFNPIDREEPEAAAAT